MSTQRDRFEALIKPERLSKFLDSHNRPTDIYVENHIRSMWEGFQLGEASGMELAAKVCDEAEDRFLNARDIDDDYSASSHCSNLCGILAKQIRALMAREE